MSPFYSPKRCEKYRFRSTARPHERARGAPKWGESQRNKPNNKGHSKNSRAEAGKGTYTQFEPARTYTQIYNLNARD